MIPAFFLVILLLILKLYLAFSDNSDHNIAIKGVFCIFLEYISEAYLGDAL